MKVRHLCLRDFQGRLALWNECLPEVKGNAAKAGSAKSRASRMI